MQGNSKVEYFIFHDAQNYRCYFNFCRIHLKIKKDRYILIFYLYIEFCVTIQFLLF